jgi:hypothetical protein
VGLERHLRVCPAAPEHVQAHAGHDGRQPPTKVLDVLRPGAAQPEPRFLHGVVGLAERAEHPVGHRPQADPMLLEPLGQRLVGVHPSHPPVATCHPCEPTNGVGVTEPPSGGLR